MPNNDQIWPKICIFGQFGPGHAGLFGALLVGRLVVVARGAVSRKTPIYFIVLLFNIGKYEEKNHQFCLAFGLENDFFGKKSLWGSLMWGVGLGQSPKKASFPNTF